MTRRASARRKEAPDAPLKKARGRLVTLEEGIRLSESRIWDLQRRFFIEQDPRAWGKGRVPSYITSNAYIARATARAIGGWLDDAAAGRLGPLDSSAPMDVLELGSGSGRAAYGVVRELEARAGTASRAGLRTRLIITDLHEAPVDALRQNTHLKQFVERGQLDFAVFDAESPGEVHLLESGETLRPGTERNPLAVLANYVFDGIRMDAFETREGRLHESLLHLTCPQGRDPAAPSTLAELRLRFEPRLAAKDVYGDPALDALLHRCAEQTREGGLLFPISALRLLRHLRELGAGRLLVLAADRGHVHEQSLPGLGPPHLMRHGSVSFDVNFHALAEEARSTGGLALLPAHHPTHLATVGLVWGAPAEGRSVEAYRDHLGVGGPEDIYLVNETMQRAKNVDTEHALAWLRASAWDPEIFLRCGARFIEEAEFADPTVQLDLLDAARNVRAAYFPVGGDLDVHMALGELFESLAEFPEAIEMFEASMGIHGRNATTLHRVAACLSSLERTTEALALLEEALALDPKHEDARAMRRALRAEARKR